MNGTDDTEMQPLTSGDRTLETVRTQEGEPTDEEWMNFKDSVRRNNITGNFPRKCFNDFDENHLKKPVLVLSCEHHDGFENVTATTMELLIKKGARTDYVDQTWYGWEPLHYAACGSNPEELKVICDNIDRSKINTLTILSENALHILLEHGKLAQSFNITYQNGQVLKMSKIINKEEQNITKCVKCLIEAGVDINHNNFWNETPILIAIKRKYYDVVSLLLKEKNIDLDSCRDGVSGKTARELLKGKENLGTLPPASVTNSSEKLLFQFLKSGDEESFLKFNTGKIQEFVNEALDGDGNQNSSCTLLQYCFRKSMILWHHSTKMFEDEFQFCHQDMTSGNRAIDVFCQSGMAKCMQHLLDNEADVNFSLDKFEDGRSLLQAAIIKGFYPVVALILSRTEYNLPGSGLNIIKIKGLMDIISAALVELLKQHNRCVDLNKTLSIVLTRFIEWVGPSLQMNEASEKNLIILLKDGVRIISKENQLLILKLPGSLCWTMCTEKRSFWCGRSKTIKKFVLEDIAPEVVTTHLDECVESNGQIQINCDSFLKNSSLLPIFKIFLSSKKLKEYLNHSVFKILAMQQWENLHMQSKRVKWKYFNINLSFYVCFYLFINIYVLCKFNNHICAVLDVLGWVFLGIFIAKELFQFVAKSRLYLTQINNYIEIFFIACAIIVFTTTDFWVDIAEVWLVLSSNLVLLFLLMNVPACAKYVVILHTILFYIKYLSFYFVQLLAFSICFYILFSRDDQVIYIDLPNKIFETIILFTGNLEYMKTPWTEESDNNCTYLGHMETSWQQESNNNCTKPEFIHSFTFKEPFSKIVFILFVLFFAIILQNLLVGLLVIDMKDLQKEVELTQQVKRVGFVVRLETFFASVCIRKTPLRHLYQRKHDERKITVKESDLEEKVKQNLNLILSEKRKTTNLLNRTRSDIMNKINERSCETLRKEKNKEIAEKLEVIYEEIVKSLHEMNLSKKN